MLRQSSFLSSAQAQQIALWSKLETKGGGGGGPLAPAGFEEGGIAAIDAPFHDCDDWAWSGMKKTFPWRSSWPFGKLEDAIQLCKARREQ